MSELMLVNPRRKARKATRRRTRARRHMTALQRKYFGPRRAKRRTVRRTARRRVESLAINPRRKRRASHHRRRRITSLRSNPRRLGSMKGFVNATLVPAGVGALGALGVDLVIGYASPHLPATFQSGMMLNAVKIAGAVGVGMVAGMVAGKKFGEEAMAGAITVTLYDIVKGYVKSAMPSLPLSGYDMGWISPAYQLPAPNMGMYIGQDNAYNGGMGMYIGETEGDYTYR